MNINEGGGREGHMARGFGKWREGVMQGRPSGQRQNPASKQKQQKI
jgi:hypothetical protein